MPANSTSETLRKYLADPPMVGAEHGSEVSEVLGDGEIAIDGERLGDVADVPAQRGRSRRQAEDVHRAPKDPLDADDRPDERGLPRTARPEQPGDRALRDGEREIREHRMAAPAHREVLHLDGIHRTMNYRRAAAASARLP